jgi:ATP adenylyltransferase
VDQLPIDACPFCNLPQDRVFYKGQFLKAVWDIFPVSPGHALLISDRHVATWFEASLEEQQDLIASIAAVRGIIDKLHSPDGYNIGLNIGEAAGQTVFHLHIHVIPRFRGDMADPAGGVRHVIPERGNYRKDAQAFRGSGKFSPGVFP